MPWIAALLLGLLLGARHAFEPDHLAAVSTLATGDARSRGGLWLGAWWGLGQTASLAAVGGSLALLEAQLPERLGAAAEVLVGLMLIALGGRAVWRAFRAPHVAHSPHRHGLGGHTHLGRWTFSPRAMVVGLVHGLAGSGALTALAVARTQGVGARVAFIVLFGVGSTAGMAALTGLFAATTARASKREGVGRWLGAAAGALSLVLGVAWTGGAAALLWS